MNIYIITWRNLDCYEGMARQLNFTGTIEWYSFSFSFIPSIIQFTLLLPTLFHPKTKEKEKKRIQENRIQKKADDGKAEGQ